MYEMNGKNKFAAKLALFISMWALTIAGFAVLVYCFGGFSKFAEIFVKIPADDGPEGLGLGIAFSQIFLVIAGVGVAVFIIPRIVGTIGFTVKFALKSEKCKGFIITAAVPCIPNALLYAFCAFLGFNYLKALSVMILIFAICEIAEFIASIIYICLTRTKKNG